MTEIMSHPPAVYEELSYSADDSTNERIRETQDEHKDAPAMQPQLSRSFFRKLTKLVPEQLIELIGGHALDPADLTFAAEIAGEIEDGRLVVPALINLLDHDSSLVREGAIYGLSNHLTGAVRRRLRLLALNDASQGVRDAASDALED